MKKKNPYKYDKIKLIRKFEVQKKTMKIVGPITRT